jgi:thiamine kinase-like enzyme
MHANDDETVHHWLARIPLLAERPATAWQVTPLVGMTNLNWRVTQGDRDLVLRVPGASSERYLSRRREFHNAGIAADLGIAPALLYADAESGVTLQPFLRNTRALTEEAFAKPEIAGKVGALLAKLHRSGRAFEGTMAPFPIIDVYLDLAADARLKGLRHRAEPIRAVLERGVPAAVPSHIDPNPANFLLGADDQLWLIDWEFSAMCEPAWDLAAVTLEAKMAPDCIAALHEGYGWRPTPAEASRLWLMRAALYLVAGSWTYAEIAGGNRAAGLPELLERCLQGLEAKLSDPALERHLAASR